MALVWICFTFVLGCCVGSFLNVVIYRLPLDKSLITPPSSCPKCGKGIRFYDNIPLVSWLALGGKCRNCKTPISPRYFIIEFFTGLIFCGLFVLYFVTRVRYFEIGGDYELSSFIEGGWLIYLIHIVLLAGFIAASAIDLELWVIPLSICWFVTLVAIIGSAVAPMVMMPAVIEHYNFLPYASAKTGLLAAGALVGIVISVTLLATGVIKQSYEVAEESDSGDETEKAVNENEVEFNHYVEMSKELLFLLPIIVCSLGFFFIFRKNPTAYSWWLNFSQKSMVAGFLGSVWGYFVGCGIVWATRILGTLGFNKEAMGMGDVHLMGAAGTVVGPIFVVVAFFIAPFFGLVWAGFQMFLKKTRQIPYGPFLSLGVLSVMIFHDWIFSYLVTVFYQ